MSRRIPIASSSGNEAKAITTATSSSLDVIYSYARTTTAYGSNVESHPSFISNHRRHRGTARNAEGSSIKRRNSAEDTQSETSDDEELEELTSDAECGDMRQISEMGEVLPANAILHASLSKSPTADSFRIPDESTSLLPPHRPQPRRSHSSHRRQSFVSSSELSWRETIEVHKGKSTYYQTLFNLVNGRSCSSHPVRNNAVHTVTHL